MSAQSSAGARPGRAPDRISAAAGERPLLRGTLHLAAALAAPFATAVLLLIASSPRAYVGGAIFGASLILLYGTSATYHMVRWTPHRRAILKRIDHSMIFVLIAGTYTPFCLIVLDNAWGISMLSIVWSVAGAGVLMKVVWPGVPRWLSVGGYLAVGWLAVIAAVPVTSSIERIPLLLLALGGALYSAGGVVYAARRPDPLPRVFGYHEVFHACVVGGSAVHFALVAAYVLPG